MLAFAYNTNGFAHHDLDACLDVLADLGYAGVGLTLDVQHLHPFRATAAEVAAVAAGLRRRGLRAVVETGARYLLDPRRKHEPTLLDPDPAARARRLDFLFRAIDIATDLGAEAVALFSGRRAPDVPEPLAWEHLVAGLTRVLDRAERRGLAVGFEPEPGMLVEDLAGYERLRDRLGARLELTLDVGHVACTETRSIPDAIARSADRIVNVHVEDIRGREHVHLPFGEGDIAFGPALAALEAAGYRGLVQVELSRQSHEAPEAARRSIEFLRDAAG